MRHDVFIWERYLSLWESVSQSSKLFGLRTHVYTLYVEKVTACSPPYVLLYMLLLNVEVVAIVS
jgi:hypothetical protein